MIGDVDGLVVVLAMAYVCLGYGLTLEFAGSRGLVLGELPDEEDGGATV